MNLGNKTLTELLDGRRPVLILSLDPNEDDNTDKRSVHVVMDAAHIGSIQAIGAICAKTMICMVKQLLPYMVKGEELKQLNDEIIVKELLDGLYEGFGGELQELEGAINSLIRH